MTTPVEGAKAAGSSPLTPERWRVVDAILKGALACEPPQRPAFVADACGEDDELRREVVSLLAVHDSTDDDFLERPAAEALGALGAVTSLAERLGKALAGRYAIERELAHGGMATVFLARDLRHDRRVAIKVLHEELAAAVGAERFLEEIRVTASLQHPHILPLFDSGVVHARHRGSVLRAESTGLPGVAREDGDGPSLLWYVMPFVEGETLRSRLAREGRLPVDVAVQVAREMADALEHAHRHGVVHRDVKPENVLLQDGHAVIADFGIALALEHAGGDRLTRTGIMIGTPQYMAPEQAAADRAIDARADVYALGAVLHEMLAGESPFAAASQAAVLWRVRNEPPTALAAHRVDVASFLDDAVRRALAKRPEDRFPSAAAFASALAPPAGGTAPASDALGSASRHAGTSRGRMVSARAAAFAAIAALIAGLVGGWALGRSQLSQGSPDTSPSLSPATNGADVGWRPSTPGADQLVVVDRAGRPQRSIAATRPWTPRFSPDGRRVAYGAFGAGRNTSDLWVTDLDAGTTQRLTDDDADSNDPQWSSDGTTIAYSASRPGGKDVLTQQIGGDEARELAPRDGTQFPSDWLRDGSALLVTEESNRSRHDIIIQPADGSTARPYAATPADETAARVSPDGRWVAYTSDESGRPEVYLDSYRHPGRRVPISSDGGVHPVWRGDGRELYYWRDEELIAVQLGATAGDVPPPVGVKTVLFRASYAVGPNTMYDVSPDGQRFLIVGHR